MNIHTHRLEIQANKIENHGHLRGELTYLYANEEKGVIANRNGGKITAGTLDIKGYKFINGSQRPCISSPIMPSQLNRTRRSLSFGYATHSDMSTHNLYGTQNSQGNIFTHKLNAHVSHFLNINPLSLAVKSGHADQLALTEKAYNRVKIIVRDNMDIHATEHFDNVSAVIRVGADLRINSSSISNQRYNITLAEACGEVEGADYKNLFSNLDCITQLKSGHHRIREGEFLKYTSPTGRILVSKNLFLDGTYFTNHSSYLEVRGSVQSDMKHQSIYGITRKATEQDVYKYNPATNLYGFLALYSSFTTEKSPMTHADDPMLSAVIVGEIYWQRRRQI